MVARGQTGQWGSEPMSRNEKMVARLRAWAAGDGLWVMEDDGAVVGALVVGERPEHVHAVDEPELYVELLLSSRARAGDGSGRGWSSTRWSWASMPACRWCGSTAGRARRDWSA